MPGLMARRQEEERRARVAQRLHKQMGAVLLDPEGGYGRCAPCGQPPLPCMRLPCCADTPWRLLLYAKTTAACACRLPELCTMFTYPEP